MGGSFFAPTRMIMMKDEMGADAHAGMPSIALGATEGDLGVTAAKWDGQDE